MAIVNLTATKRPNRSFPSMSIAGIVAEQFATITTNADDSDTSTYTMFTGVPIEGRLWHGSEVANDDLATSGSPDLDLGIFPEQAQFTGSSDALVGGLNAAAAGVHAMLADHKEWGKPLYEYLSLTETPGGTCSIVITIDTANINQAGDISALLRIMPPVE